MTHPADLLPKNRANSVPEPRKPKQQEEEITRPKRIVADLMLNKRMLQYVLSKKL